MEAGAVHAIDIHVHHRWNDPSGPRPEHQLGRMKELAGRNGIDRVLLLTLARGQSPEDTRKRNDATLRLMAEDPGFFLGACYLNATLEPAFNREEAARCVRAGMVAVKQHMDSFADDPRQDAVSNAAADLDVPIVWHAWYKKSDGYPNESDASHVARLARRTPRTRYVMAHLTGVGRRGVQDVADLPNVWVDTSGCWPESEIVEYAVRELGADRVVYGSDFSGRDYAVQLARVEGAAITGAEREKILWRNAASLLQLDRRGATP
jgi:uncharacterized protein